MPVTAVQRVSDPRRLLRWRSGVRSATSDNYRRRSQHERNYFHELWFPF